MAIQNNVPINLKNTISGFADGVKGMYIGETREIYIHPTVAYGFDTSLEKCIYLRGVVTLLKIYNYNDTNLPINNMGFGFLPSDYEGEKTRTEVNSIDLSFLMDKDTLGKREENYKLALQAKGIKIAQHLKKCPAIDLAIVKNYLTQFFDNQEYIVTSQWEQDIINQVHCKSLKSYGAGAPQLSKEK